LDDLVRILVLTLFAGMAMPLGAFLSAAEHIKRDWLQAEIRHFVMAFGGGALLSAVALVLVPEGSENLGIFAVAFWFAAGGLVFMCLDIWLDRLKSPLAQLVAMLSDFIPEALALGAALAMGSETALLLAGLIALQNLPEGFNSSRELQEATDFDDKQITIIFILLALLGPVFGLLGFYVLADSVIVISSIMLFAAGGILYVTFSDIAPQAKLKNHWFPPIGAVAGFLLGVIGQLLVGPN
jgi:ZIP family zinc transporter